MQITTETKMIAVKSSFGFENPNNQFIFTRNKEGIWTSSDTALEITDSQMEILYQNNYVKEYKEYKLEVQNGVLGDFATEYWQTEDWERWEKDVEQLKKDGTYLNKHEIKIVVEYNPLLDGINTVQATTSLNFIILDFSKNDKYRTINKQ